MAVRIFETDPHSKPKPRRQFADDYAFRFRSGQAIGASRSASASGA
jgi:hypothetical protein